MQSTTVPSAATTLGRGAESMPDRLAASAFALFSRHGIGDVTVDEVARHAGVTKGSLYWHYRSKDDLIKAACAHYYQLYHRRINTALAQVVDPVARLEKTLQIAVRICLLDHANRVFSTEIFTLALTNPELRRSWQQFLISVREFYIGLEEAARATGKVRTADPEQSVDLMLASMEGIKLQALYDARLCLPRSEKAIVANLKRTLGFIEPKP
jgi:AcrR family transcriptional regulator